QAAGVRPLRPADADAVLPELEEALQRVEEGRRLVPRGDPHLRRGGEGQQHGGGAEVGGPPTTGDQHLHQGLAGVEEPMNAARAVAGGLLLVAGAARAQRPDRSAVFGAPGAGARRTAGPSEESIFGGSGAGSPPAAAEQGQPGPGSTEAEGLDRTPSSDAFATGAVKEDPLKIGGLFYSRAFMAVRQDQPLNQSRAAGATPAERQLHARPTDRLPRLVPRPARPGPLLP